MNMKRFFHGVLVFSFLAVTACTADAAGLKAVCSNFPSYDFTRHVLGDGSEIKMLLKPGMEAHGYEPTMQDIAAISDCDLFVFTGGESDVWAERLLNSLGKKGPRAVRLVDLVDTVSEEIAEGMQADHGHHHGHNHGHTHCHDLDSPDGLCNHEHDHDDGHDHCHEHDSCCHEHSHDDGHTHCHDHDSDGLCSHHNHDEHHEEEEIDEHVWTSPANAVKLVSGIADSACAVDPVGCPGYRERAGKYIESLEKLDDDFSQMIKNSKRHEIIVADRFPFRYLVDEFGLSYYAAFPGCAAQVDVNPATIAFLIDKVKADKIPVVFHIELSPARIARAVAKATGADIECLHAVHNITLDDYEKGEDYESLMRKNLKVLEKALN